MILGSDQFWLFFCEGQGASSRRELMWVYQLAITLKYNFFIAALLTFWGQIILHSRGCSVHCGIFISIFGFYPLVASSIPQVVTTKDVPRHHYISPEGAKSYPVQNYYLKTATISFHSHDCWSHVGSSADPGLHTSASSCRFHWT